MKDVHQSPALYQVTQEVIRDTKDSAQLFVEAIAENIPGGWWTILGLILIGGFFILTIKFKKKIKKWVGNW